jgi:PAS domain S-box-containing protein
MNQPIPQSVALLLADAQRREKKKTAKRVANRKSASTSRARKKALVEEMTRTNARLKRQALILALLPDLVIATSLDGEVTFCSAQVERILGHKSEDLVGVQLDKVLVPSSGDTLQNLFKRLINPGTRSSRQPQGRRGTKRRHGEPKESTEKAGGKDADGDGKGDSSAHARESLLSSDANGDNNSGNSGAAIISETSFPLSVVEVESKQRAKMPAHEHTNAIENSDNSTSNNSASNNSGRKMPVSSLSNSHSPTNSPSEDDGAQGDAKESSKRAKTTEKGKDQTSSGDDSSSSLSSKAENMRKANDNLDRNVRWHNQRFMGDSQKAKSDDGPKDDVTGASVTANNASARLSSLEHVTSPPVKKSEKSSSRYENDQSSSDDSLLVGVEEKKKVGDTSDDSGYRESNDSREETSSSGSDSLNSKSKSRFKVFCDNVKSTPQRNN